MKRRARIPDKPNYSLNLWSIMKNCIGRELSRIPMPVATGQESLGLLPCGAHESLSMLFSSWHLRVCLENRDLQTVSEGAKAEFCVMKGLGIPEVLIVCPLSSRGGWGWQR